MNLARRFMSPEPGDLQALCPRLVEQRLPLAQRCAPCDAAPVIAIS